MGVDDNGRFTSLYGAGLADPDKPPFTGGRIISSGKWFDLAAGLLPPVTAATVNMASGSEAVIKRIRNAWDPDIETMEGAWLAYNCAMAGIPWIAVRAISNMVEPRNLKKWNIPLALDNLEMKMKRLMELVAPVAQNMKKTD
jgi:futalosine hydrolase